MRVGFFGLGNVGSKLASNLLRNGYELTVPDQEPSEAVTLLKDGARRADNESELAQMSDVVITCLPSPAASAEVMQGEMASSMPWSR